MKQNFRILANLCDLKTKNKMNVENLLNEINQENTHSIN